MPFRSLILFFLTFNLLFFCYACSQPEPEPSSSPPPNIIYILADDLGYGDIGVYGQQQISTPNIDQLAQEGIRFTQHYAGSTVCAPSRCVLMTGMHTGRATIRGNATVPLAPNDTTIAELLKMAGYKTAMVGKWGLGEAGSTGVPNKQGFDYFYGYLNQIHAHNSYPDYLWENQNVDSLANVVEIIPESYAKGIGGVATEKNTFAQDVFMEKALDFIQQNKDTSFFLYLPFTIPHANNEAWYWDSLGMEIPSFGAYADKDWPDAQKAHAAMISYLDQNVGQIIAALKAADLTENTLLVFTSDNGPHNEGGARHDFFDSNGPLKGSKRDLYEGGIRVPAIACWPGTIAEGQESDHLSAFWDVLPTFCDLAGVPIPTGVNGISFLPTLLGQEQPQHDYLYWEFYEQEGKKAIRMNNWKLVQIGLNAGETLQTQLFDLSRDIGEENDLANSHPEVVKQAKEWMAKAHTPSEHFQFD